MKKAIIILLPFLILCSACPQEKVIIQSQWKLIEQLADPGDGSGVFTSVESDRTIDFLEDGTMTSNGNLCEMTVSLEGSGSGTYSEEEGHLYLEGCSSEDFKIGYEIIDDFLYLYYPCIEPCRQKYERVN